MLLLPYILPILLIILRSERKNEPKRTQTKIPRNRSRASATESPIRRSPHMGRTLGLPPPFQNEEQIRKPESIEARGVFPFPELSKGKLL